MRRVPYPQPILSLVADKRADYQMFVVGFSQLQHATILNGELMRHPRRRGARIHSLRVKLTSQGLANSRIHEDFGPARLNNNFLLAGARFGTHEQCTATHQRVIGQQNEIQ